jgi:uncharacterized protein with beta-barrel porin domain
MRQSITRAARNLGWPKSANRLWGAASTLALAAAFCGVGAAGSAQAAIPNTNLSAGSDTCIIPAAGLTSPASVTVTTGESAYFAPVWAPNSVGGPLPASAVAITNFCNSAGAAFTGTVPISAATNGGSALAYQINVQSGATLTFANLQSLGPGVGGLWTSFYNMINSAGDVNFEGGQNSGQPWQIDGANTFTGNINFEAGTYVLFGASYGAGELTLGPNTNLTMGANSYAYLNDAAGFTTTMGGMLAGVSTAKFELAGGTLVINGQNTVANPFVGTLQVDPGATLVIGDSTHPGAIFGDPGNTNGSTETLNIGRTGGSPATLQGYGAIYATVNNSGIVQPGGTQGAPGALTVSQYNQTGTGILQIALSPNGASELKVLGTATLDGTLALNFASGHYGNQIFPIVSAGTLNIASTLQVTTSGPVAGGLKETSTGIDVVTEQTSSVQVFGHLASADRSNVLGFNDTLYDIQTSDGATASAAPKTDYGNGFDAWLEPFGRTASIGHDGPDYRTSSGGLTGGLEHKWNNNAVAGLSVSYANETLKTDADMTNSTSNTVDLGLYGGYKFENARVEGVLFYNTYSANVSRNLGSVGTIGSSPSGQALGASLQISNNIYSDIIEPYIRMTFSDIRQARVAENGTNLLALDVNAIEKGYFDGEVGVKIHPTFITVAASLHPEITLAVQHDFTQNPGEQAVAQFANLSGSPFAYSWKGDQGTAAIAGLMLSSDVASNLQIFGKVDGRFSSYGQSGEIRLGGSYRF